MKTHKKKLVKKTIKGTKKLLEVMKAKKYSFVRAFGQMVFGTWFEAYSSSSTDWTRTRHPFSWFPEVANTRLEADKDPLKAVGWSYKIKIALAFMVKW